MRPNQIFTISPGQIFTLSFKQSETYGTFWDTFDAESRHFILIISSLTFYYFISFLFKKQIIKNKLMRIKQQSMGSGPNWYHIGNRTCYTPKVRKFYVEKGYL